MPDEPVPLGRARRCRAGARLHQPCPRARRVTGWRRQVGRNTPIRKVRIEQLGIRPKQILTFQG